MSDNAGYSVSEDAMARLACAMLMSFEGTIGIYQGEELGQTETELVFEELTDPPAIRYWPAVKGRDGCRTPMVWDANAANAGFSDSVPWLPVKPPQTANAVKQQPDDGIMAFYKSMIAFRKNSSVLSHGSTRFIALAEPLLAFTRTQGAEHITCVFNLSKDKHTISLIGAADIICGSSASIDSSILTLDGNGFAYLTHSDMAVI